MKRVMEKIEELIVDREKAKGGFSWMVRIGQTIGALVVFLLVLWAVSSFSKPGPAGSPEQVVVEKVVITEREVQVTEVVEKVVVVPPTETPVRSTSTPLPTNPPPPTSTLLPTLTPIPLMPTPVPESEIPECPFEGKLADGRILTGFGWYWDNGVRRYNLIIDGEGESNGVSEHWLVEHLVWWH